MTCMLIMKILTVKTLTLHFKNLQGAYTNNTNIETIHDFDTIAGDMEIYPTYYHMQEYRCNIVGKALYKNMLEVVLTGQSKVFIAADVMYSVYHGYPRGKIVFMAPTKPLVVQQMEA